MSLEVISPSESRWLAKSFDITFLGKMLLTIAYAIDRKKQIPFGGTLTRTMVKFDKTLSTVEDSLLLLNQSERVSSYVL